MTHQSHRFNIDYYSNYADKIILITGSVGTVGSELLRQLIRYNPAEIRLFDNNESGLYMQMQANTNCNVNLTPILGDIRDGGKLQSVMHGVDTIFHLAAYKHVSLCEYNPFDSVRTNVIGTQNVLKAAIDARVKRLIYSSSDKAVNPTNVMGTSKLLAERVVIAASMLHCNGNGQIFSITRFGNVLGSNGSVVPIFLEQIKRGGPVTVTHKRMTRFALSIEDAVRLVIKGGAIACGGEVFISKMPVIKIVDLADVMIKLLAPLYGYKPEDIPVEYVGIRPGEKLFEELMGEEEMPRALELDEMFAVLPTPMGKHNYRSYSYSSLIREKVDNPYISRNEKPISIDELKDYFIQNKLAGEEITKQIVKKSVFSIINSNGGVLK